MKVFIENSNLQYNEMFKNNGWDLTMHLGQADLLCFTGGSDVSPHYYGAKHHPYTMNNEGRDAYCFDLYEKFKGKPKVGICRGGQFLNVANGGRMWQDVNNHAIRGTHKIKYGDREVEVSSTHHQMMIPNLNNATIMGVAALSTRREFEEVGQVDMFPILPDIEIVWYQDSQSMCFQPHPEFFKPDHECQRLFFETLELIL